MLLQEKLETYSFSASERHVVNYLLKEQHNIQNQTTTEIAKATLSSKSTLVRIAQKLNYDGWLAFKTDYLNELDYLAKSDSSIDANYPFTKADSFVSVANKIAKLEIESIEDTLSLVTHDDLRAVVNILMKSRWIHLFAVSSNLLVAQTFQHQMKRIKKEVRIHSLQSEVLFDAQLADADSCAMIITYSGETTILNRIADLLNENKVPIIAITSIGENTTAKKAAVTLNISTRERLYSKISTFSTDTATSYLLNVIYSCIFSQEYDENVRLKITSSKQIETERSSDSSILKER